MKMDINGLVANIKQLFGLVAVIAGVICVLKIPALGLAPQISGSLMDWAAIAIATSLASK
jgi:hypothetical protein